MQLRIIRGNSTGEFGSMHRNVGRRGNPEPHFVTLHFDDQDFNLIVDDNRLVFLPRQYEHRFNPLNWWWLLQRAEKTLAVTPEAPQ